MEATNRSVMPGLWEIFTQRMHMYYIPVLVCLGSLGNCLSVCVLFRTKMRRSSSSFYLAALAISDTGFLMSLMVVWLDLLGVSLFNRSGFCQFFIYMTTLCSFLSVWFVVAFTVERFVAVRYPLRRQAMCTVTRAKSIIVGLGIVGLVVCSPVLWYSSPMPMSHNSSSIVCTVPDEWLSWASAFNVFDTVVTFALPFTVIVVLNGMIVENVWRLDRIRGAMTSSTRNRVEDRSPGQNSPRAPVPQSKVTNMLLIVSSVFLCFNLPAYVMRVYAFLKVV